MANQITPPAKSSRGDDCLDWLGQPHSMRQPHGFSAELYLICVISYIPSFSNCVMIPVSPNICPAPTTTKYVFSESLRYSFTFFHIVVSFIPLFNLKLRIYTLLHFSPLLILYLFEQLSSVTTPFNQTVYHNSNYLIRFFCIIIPC